MKWEVRGVWREKPIKANSNAHLILLTSHFNIYKRIVYAFCRQNSENREENELIMNKKTVKDIDVNELFTSAITGKIDNDTIIKSIVSLVGKEVLNCATVLGSILVIIIIHSILKSISEGLENKNVAQITYYVQYILIVLDV